MPADRVHMLESGNIEASWSLPEARRTAVFWIFCAMYLATFAVVFFPLAHFAALAVDLGWGASGGAAFFSIAAAAGVVGRLGIGWLSDKVSAKTGLVALLSSMIAANLLFASFSNAPSLYAAAALFGAGAGSAVALYPVVVSELFGRVHMGTIAGFAFAFTCTGGGLGPIIGGWIRDETGSYDTACVFAFSCALILRPPRRTASDRRPIY